MRCAQRCRGAQGHPPVKPHHFLGGEESQGSVQCCRVPHPHDVHSLGQSAHGLGQGGQLVPPVLHSRAHTHTHAGAHAHTHTRARTHTTLQCAVPTHHSKQHTRGHKHRAPPCVRVGALRTAASVPYSKACSSAADRGTTATPSTSSLCWDANRRRSREVGGSRDLRHSASRGEGHSEEGNKRLNIRLNKGFSTQLSARIHRGQHATQHSAGCSESMQRATRKLNTQLAAAVRTCPQACGLSTEKQDEVCELLFPISHYLHLYNSLSIMVCMHQSRTV